MNIEDINYFNDPRVLARERGNWYDHVIDRNTVQVTCYDEKSDTFTLNVMTQRAVCPTCDGIGTHTNPSIDAGGITSDEFYELDEDDRAGYLEGRYDVPCYQCEGNKVVRVPHEDETDFITYLREREAEEARYEAERASERRMGC